MANTISKIQLPNNGGTYDIYDAKAFHSLEDLGLSAALTFKGVLNSIDELPSSAKAGDFYVVIAEGGNVEYVRTDEGEWELLGPAHDYATSSHRHVVSVNGTNQPSKVTGSVTIPTISSTTKYVKATVSRGNVSTNKALGEEATFSTVVTPTLKNIKANVGNVGVGANGTADAITGLGTPDTKQALGTGATFKVTGGTANTSKLGTTTIKNPTVEPVSIPNVTAVNQNKAAKVTNAGNKSNGSAAAWSASVDSNGVLSFSWTPNTPTTVTLPTFGEVDVSQVALGTAISASLVTTNNVTVATGSLLPSSSSGTGASVATGINAIGVSVNSPDTVKAVTGLGTPTTKTVLTGVQVTTQPTVGLTVVDSGTDGSVQVATGISGAQTQVNEKDAVTAITSVPVPTVTLATNTTSGDITLVDKVTIGQTSASLADGQAAAQTWNGSATCSEPQG